MAETRNKDLDDKIKILLAIPLYNNRKTIKSVVEGALKSGLDILVVDDGSDDGGAELLEPLGVSVLVHSRNMGKGKTISSAAGWAQERAFSHIITIDADGQHDPSDIGKFVDKIMENPKQIIVGARDMAAANAPFSSRLGKCLSNFWLKIIAGTTLPDSQCGFRAYPLNALNMTECRSSRYDYEIEILVRSSWAGYGVDSVNVSVEYTKETNKASHFKPWLDNFRCAKIFASLLLRRIFLK
jgi:glycosyltransferase involved in cell wall biosynthesis